MNFSIKNVLNCQTLSDEKIKGLAQKFGIGTTGNINKSNRKNICDQINKVANEINPCGMALSTDTNLQLKKHQLNISNKLSSNKTKGLIVVHSVGTGKTLSAISCAQCLLNKKIVDNIIVITPTSLQQNFIKQAHQYGLSKTQLDKYYTFYTMQTISNLINESRIANPTNSLVIIDEAHNLRTIDGARFDSIFKYVTKAEKVLLLTATPLINYNYDIINLVSLATGTKPLTIEKFESIVEKHDVSFKKYVSGIFDFYVPNTESHIKHFPTKKITEIFLCMENEYLKTYEKIESGQESKISDFKDKNIHVFYNGLRRASNVIENKSPKVDWIKEKIQTEPDEKYVIFSHFINMGMVPVMKWLNKMKIPFVHVTGDLSIEKRGKAVEKYNNDEIKILFISKAGSEGLDLKNTKYIIIMESGWNENSLEQIIGRGVRYKSHETLGKSKRNVSIYRLYCIKPYEYTHLNKITASHILQLPENQGMMSVDLYLRNYSWSKQQSLDKFQKELMKYNQD